MKNKLKVIHKKIYRDSFTVEGRIAADRLSAIVHPTNKKIYMSWVGPDFKEQEVGLSRLEAEAWVVVLQAAMKHQDQQEKSDD